MTLLVVATYPVEGGPLLEGPVTLSVDGAITIAGTKVPNSQGASAMLGAAVQASARLGASEPNALVAGDIGRGDGTRKVYERLPEAAHRLQPSVIAFHYLQPVMALIRRALSQLGEAAPDAMLVADAGGMYAAKAASVAPHFELMTPDVGEVGFLADPQVTHPAYVSRYLFGADGFGPSELARIAHENGGAARTLIIKGGSDLVTREGVVRCEIVEPCVPELEAIGGTGDTLTGLAAAFLAGGFPTVDAARCACLANREAGLRMGATPAMRATDLVAALPGVLAANLCSWGSAIGKEKACTET